MTLASLYRGARFTIFPSLYEGWGLPVTESLGYGKVCIASSSTSIPRPAAISASTMTPTM